MILKNYYHALSIMALNSSVSMTGVQGSTYNSFSASSVYKLLALKSAMATVCLNTYGTGVVFGTGRTAEALADYKLSGTQITTLSGAGQVKSSLSGDILTLTSVLTVTNISSSEITIGEVGLQINYTGNWSFMLDRTLLEEAITVPAGGVAQITYTIKLVYPND